METINDNRDNTIHENFKLFKDDKLIASIATYDPEGSKALAEIFRLIKQ